MSLQAASASQWPIGRLKLIEGTNWDWVTRAIFLQLWIPLTVVWRLELWSKIWSFLFFLHSVCIFEFRRDGMFFLLTISDQVIQVSDIFSEHIVWTVEIFFESTFPTLKRSEWIQFWNFVSSDLLWRKKNWCFLADLFWEICVTVYTYMLSGYLPVRQRLHKVFPKHLFSCLVDLRLFSDNLHQINIGKKDKIFMYIIKYIVVIYHICHWLKKQR